MPRGGRENRGGTTFVEPEPIDARGGPLDPGLFDNACVDVCIEIGAVVTTWDVLFRKFGRFRQLDSSSWNEVYSEARESVSSKRLVSLCLYFFLFYKKLNTKHKA